MYEYRVVKVYRWHPTDDLERAIEARANDMANEGWRLISVTAQFHSDRNDSTYLLTFEREVGNG